MSSVFRPWVRKNGKSVRSPNYVVQFRDPVTGKKRRVYLKTSNKKVALQAAAKVVERAELEALGVIPSATPSQAPLADSLKDYAAVLQSRGLTPKYARQVWFRVSRLLELTGWKHPRDLEPKGLEKALAALRESGLTANTCNCYLSHAVSWAEWLRLPDPFRDVRPLRVTGKRKRRAFTDDEVERLLAAALVGKTIEKHTGEARWHLYRLAVATGLRAKELGSLTPESFDWRTNAVRVIDSTTKNRKEATLPIPTAIAADLRRFIEGKEGRIWPRMAKAFKFLRADREAAGIPAVVDGAHADFHGFRVTFATRLAKAGVLPAIAHKLLRHSNADLTIGLYTHLTAADLRAAVDGLPQYDAPTDAPRPSMEADSSGQPQTVRRRGNNGFSHSFRRKRT